MIPSIAISFAVTIAFMFALRPVARSVGLVDRPGGRKSHIGEVPVMGGMAMFIGLFSGLLLTMGASASFFSVFMASFLLVSIGVLDDKFTLPAGVRMATQFAVVLMMVYGAGLSLGSIGDPFAIGDISMGVFTLPMTVAVTLTMINAYNLVDGVDGLAGSLAVIALLALSVVGGYAHPSSALALTVVAVIVGFLVFNFPVIWNRPIRSFMGDAGSTLIGFTIVWITLGLSQGSERVISPVLCLWFAAVPIFDCLTCFVRRSIKGKSPLSPGRDHFHHVLNRGGLGVRQVLAVLTGMQLVYALIALVAYFAGIPDFAMFAAWAILGLTQRPVIKTIAKFHRLLLRKKRRIRQLSPAAP